jgi:osmotically-inducible protein OsmY
MKSDADLQHEVQDELATLRSSGADETDVHVLNGVVTLTGKVRSDGGKWSAEDAVRRMPGVKGLRDETMVVHPEPGNQPSEDTARGWFP